MALRLKQYNSFSDFVDDIEDFIDDNRQKNFFLMKAVADVAQGHVVPEQYFTLSDGTAFAVCLHIGDHLLVYTSGKHTEVAEALQDAGINYPAINAFAGSKEVIDRIIQVNNIPCDRLKHRIYYTCDEAIEPDDNPAGEFQLARTNKIEVLAKHATDFSREFYGQEVITAREMRTTVLASINESHFYQWYHKEIVAFASAVHEKNPDWVSVGQLYTIPKFRGHGYSSALLYELTALLLEEEGYRGVFLYTDGSNPVSNRVVQKVGYTIQDEYTMCSRQGMRLD